MNGDAPLSNRFGFGGQSDTIIVKRFAWNAPNLDLCVTQVKRAAEVLHMPDDNLAPYREQLVDFCRRRKVAELSLFGSILRDDFNPGSDVDVLVSFRPDAQWSLLDWVDMQDELQALFGRRVDLVSRGGLRNPFRRHEILSNREIVYAA